MNQVFCVDFMTAPETLDEQSRTPPISGYNLFAPLRTVLPERAWMT
jgi:hypothetical protein